MGIRGNVLLQTPRSRGRARAPRRLLGAALAVALVATPLSSVGPAGAAFPGANGKIAFVIDRDGDREIFVMNSDGSGQTQLTDNTAFDVDPAWSPDGTKIAFTSTRDGDGEIFVMNADGSAQTPLTGDGSNGSPAWSPDGTKIAFGSSRDGDGEIFVMNADGSAQTQLTNNLAFDGDPAWSPRGTKIAFWRGDRNDGGGEIFVMNPDGSGRTQLTSNSTDADPAWSPDGTKIAFASGQFGFGRILVMNADGTGQTQLGGGFAGEPAWSPDGTKIAFVEFRDGYGEMFVMNADGTGHTQLTSSRLESDESPDWQPVVSPSSTSLKVIKKGRRVVAKGQVSPDHPGERVVAKLFKRKGGRFVVLATKRLALDSSSRYVARFRRPGQGRCLVKVRFAGDGDHLASAAREKFRC